MYSKVARFATDRVVYCCRCTCTVFSKQLASDLPTSLQITEGGKAIWKNDSFIDGVAGVADPRGDVDWVTFDMGSERYCFKLGKNKGPGPILDLRS